MTFTVVVPGLAGANTSHTSRDTAEAEVTMWKGQGYEPVLVPIVVPNTRKPTPWGWITTK